MITIFDLMEPIWLVIISFFCLILLTLTVLTGISYQTVLRTNANMGDINNSMIAYATKTGGWPDTGRRQNLLNEFGIKSGLGERQAFYGPQAGTFKMNFEPGSGRLQKGQTVCVDSSMDLKLFIMGTTHKTTIKSERQCGVVAPYTKANETAEYDSYVEEEWLGK